MSVNPLSAPRLPHTLAAVRQSHVRALRALTLLAVLLSTWLSASADHAAAAWRQDPPPVEPTPVAAPELAKYPIAWSDLSSAEQQCAQTSYDTVNCMIDDDTVLQDNDVLRAHRTKLVSTTSAPNWIEVSLALGSGVTAWKEIKAFDNAGQPISAIARQNTGERIVMRVPIRVPYANYMVFSKAKFGIPTGMYQLTNLQDYAGHRIDITWTRDA